MYPSDGIGLNTIMGRGRETYASSLYSLIYMGFFGSNPKSDFG